MKVEVVVGAEKCVARCAASLGVHLRYLKLNLFETRLVLLDLSRSRRKYSRTLDFFEAKLT